MTTHLPYWRHAPAGRFSPLASLLLIAPLVLLLGTVFFYPLFKILITSFWDPSFTLGHYGRLFGEELYLKIFGRTIWIALLVSVFSLFLGYPVALVMARLAGWQAGLVAACVLIPLWTSVLVRSYAWVVLLQRRGLINEGLMGMGITDEPLRMIYTNGAVLLAMTHVLLPFMILPIYTALRNISPDFARAAANLGAGSWSTFWNVTLPLGMPGVFAGVLMVFILSLGFYITPALVGGSSTLMFATLIGQQMTELLNWSFASALSVVLLVVTLVLVIVFRRSLKLDRMAGHGE